MDRHQAIAVDRGSGVEQRILWIRQSTQPDFFVGHGQLQDQRQTDPHRAPHAQLQAFRFRQMRPVGGRCVAASSEALAALAQRTAGAEPDQAAGIAHQGRQSSQGHCFCGSSVVNRSALPSGKVALRPPMARTRSRCETIHRGVSVFAPHQALQLRQDSLRCRFRKSCGRRSIQRAVVWLEMVRISAISRNPRSNRSGSSMRLVSPHRSSGSPAGRSLSPPVGSHEWLCRLQRQGDGIEPVVPAPEVLLRCGLPPVGRCRPSSHQAPAERCSVSSSTTHVPWSVLGQGLGQSHGIRWDHQIKVRLVLETVEQCIRTAPPTRAVPSGSRCSPGGQRSSQSLAQLVGLRCQALQAVRMRRRWTCASVWTAAGSIAVRPITLWNVSMASPI